MRRLPLLTHYPSADKAQLSYERWRRSIRRRCARLIAMVWTIRTEAGL